MPKTLHGLTLIELIIAISLMGLLMLGSLSIQIFSTHHVVNSSKRAKAQNEISNTIETMTKYVQQSTGNFNNPPIKLYPNPTTPTGFQVCVDFNLTPDNLADDSWISFELSGNDIIAKCNPAASGCPFPTTGESLTNIITGTFKNKEVTDDLPDPDGGFYVNITNQGSQVDIGLVGRYLPAQPVSIDNPQVFMKTRVASLSTSVN